MSGKLYQECGNISFGGQHYMNSILENIKTFGFDVVWHAITTVATKSANKGESVVLFLLSTQKFFCESWAIP